MLQVILKRITIAIPVILIVASITFFLVRMAPGGPFDAEKIVPPQVMENLNAVYNLDAPLIIQYKDYMFNLIQGDFGPSFRYPGEIMELTESRVCQIHSNVMARLKAQLDRAQGAE